MTIEISGVSIDTALRRRITVHLNDALARVHGGPVAAQVTFFDENGPKGGRDIRCALTVRMPRRRAIRVEHQAETPRLAFDGSFETLARRLGEMAERGRDLRRRPKKYFAARRLLAAEPGTEEPGR